MERMEEEEHSDEDLEHDAMQALGCLKLAK
jgi:hypothetical protein